MSIVQETLSSILCLSQRVGEVKDVVLQVYIDKFRIDTTRVFRYKETPEILSVQPDCSFNKYDLSCFHSRPFLNTFLESIPSPNLLFRPFLIIMVLHFLYFHFSVFDL